VVCIYRVTALLRLLVPLAGLAAILVPDRARAAAGDLYEADFTSNTIFKFTPGGTKSVFASGLGSPYGLAFDSSGNLFEADYNSGIIFKLTPNGTKSTFASGLNRPIGLAFDSSGNLFVADQGSDTIFKFTPAGTKSTFAFGLDGPVGLAFDSSGNLFEADFSSGTIFKFTPAGTKSIFASGLSGPVGLVFDSSGNLFEADYNSGTIFKFTPVGTQSTFASGLSNPTGLAFDSSGNLFEADQGSETIFMFTPAGTKSTFASGLSGPSGLAFVTSTAYLTNISTRALVQTGNNVLIGGFVISGTGPKKLVVRALGPTLSSFGVPGALQNPTLELHNSAGALIAFNDNWGDAPNKQQIIDAHLAPPNAAEPAILASLDPGNYTAMVRGVNNTTGVAAVEGYDIEPGTSSQLGNISTRGVVQTGAKVMIAGVIVGGSGSQKVIVRTLGPTLSKFGVASALADPTLELRDINGNLIQSNDNWRSTQQGEIIATGLQPPNDAESAIVATLVPSNYTMIVRGVNSTIGVALVEVYRLN
jgi:sugar lactone lactonase YvrE